MAKPFKKLSGPLVFLALAFFLSAPVFFPREARADQGGEAAGQAMKQPPGPVPVFDRKNPQARGVVAAFKNYPAGEIDQDRLIKKMREYGLEKTEELPFFKSWVFEWRGLRPESEAQKVCKELSGAAFLESCDPDLLAGPAGAVIRRKKKLPAKEKALYDRRPEPPAPKGGIHLNPPKTRLSETGNVKSCNIVPSQLRGRYEYKGLSDYWAQEKIGSDLMKEELKNAPRPKKHLVSVWDSPYSQRHDVGVKNLISGSGRQAVLPPLDNKNMTKFKTPYYSDYLRTASHFHRAAREKCPAFRRDGPDR